MRLFIALSLSLIILLVIESCKPGCKDKQALNYSSKATIENGTCLYCNQSLTVDSQSYFFVDFNAPSPWNNQNTFEFILATADTNVSGNGCQSIGLPPNSVCGNYLRMVNLTSKTAQGEVNVQFFQNGFQLWFFNNNNFSITLPPGGSVNFGFIDTGCSDLVSGTLSADVGSFQFN